MINKKLADRIGLSNKVQAEIGKWQQWKESLLTLISQLGVITDKPTIHVLVVAWKENEFKLQRLWGFDEDARYHRFFDLPHCNCPVLDNLERLGTDYQIHNQNCPIHGDVEEAEWVDIDCEDGDDI